jgi:hypothetical protein
MGLLGPSEEVTLAFAYLVSPISVTVQFYRITQNGCCVLYPPFPIVLNYIRTHVSFTPRKHIESFRLFLVNAGLFSTSESFFRNVQQTL